MEKIALKNIQQSAPNTYELLVRTPRQLLASVSTFQEIIENTTLEMTLTSQKWSQYDMPISIEVSEIILYFSQSKLQNMNINFGGGDIDENFVAPNNSGAVSIPIANVGIDAGVTQRMVLSNLETTPITPYPVLRSWSLVFSFLGL